MQDSTAKTKQLYYKLSLLSLTLLVTLVVLLTLYEFYRMTLNDKIGDLQIIAQSQTELIDEIFKATNDKESTIAILKKAHLQLKDIEPNGQLEIGVVESDLVRVLTWKPRKSIPETRILSKEILTGTPLGLALNEMAGKITTKDYDGENVVAAYLYIHSLQTALVAKMDLWSIQRIFLILAGKIFGIGIIFSLLAILTFNYFEKQKNKLESTSKENLEQTVNTLDIFKRGMDSHAMLCMTDEDGNIIEVNHIFCEVSGYSQEELVGKNLNILKSGEHDQEFFSHLWNTILSGRVWHGEIKNRRKDQTIFWVDTTIAPVMKNNSDKKFYICIQNDITKTKLYQQSILKAKSRAEMANRHKSSFIAHMSHEIRTPLSSIIGYIDLFEQGLMNEEADSLKYMQRIKRNATHLMNLVGEILDFSKIESGELEIKKVNVPLIPEIQKVHDFFINENPNISFSIRIIPPLPEVVFTDALRFQQVLINLIENAFKFTTKGQIRVTFRLSNSNFGEQKDKLIVEIEDTGIGVESDKQQEIFKPFVQAHNFHTREKGGTGLGLALSKDLAKLLGGDVFLLKSTPGKGSTFLFSIDFGLPSQVKMLSQLPLGNHLHFEKTILSNLALDDVKILLIEDSEDVSELIRINLIQLGAKVETVLTGEDGLNMLEHNNYDILLLDIQLPKMSGHDLIKEIRKKWPKLPVVALTAHSTRAERDKCFDNGFSEFMTKPINFNKLSECIAHFYSLHKTTYDEYEASRPLYSAFADDPVVRSHLKGFVESIPKKIQNCTKLAEENNIIELKDYCHQIKGAFGSYGYPELQEQAAKLEEICISKRMDSESLQNIMLNIDKMSELSRRAQMVLSSAN